MGESGNSMMDMVVKVVIVMLVDLLVCHCFMWLVELGGRVIVAQ